MRAQGLSIENPCMGGVGNEGSASASYSNEIFILHENWFRFFDLIIFLVANPTCQENIKLMRTRSIDLFMIRFVLAKEICDSSDC
jgi:hypothetical protein